MAAASYMVFMPGTADREVVEYVEYNSHNMPSPNRSENTDHDVPSEIGLEPESTAPASPNSETKRLSEKKYISNLLFNDSSDLFEHFLNYGEYQNNSMEEYIPLRIDYLQRSRVVIGDTSNLKQLLYRIIVEKQCITALAIGGSVTFGSGGVGKIHTWNKHLVYWLNHHPLTMDCRGEGHVIHNRGKGGWNTINHYYQLPEYFGVTKWEESLCSDIDLVIFETSANDANNAAPIEQYFEMTIRNLLLCRDRVPVILSLESVRGQGVVMKTQYGRDKWNHYKFGAGDLKRLALLNYYQIPSVSLCNIIYPLAYRYHLNYHMNDTLNAFEVLTKFYEDDRNEDVS